MQRNLSEPKEECLHAARQFLRLHECPEAEFDLKQRRWQLVY